NSSGFPNAADAIGRLVEVEGRGVRVADLAWTRLTRWRETLARIFESREYLSRLREIRKIKVSFGENHETAARYMGAWAQQSLSDAGVATELTVARGAASLTVELSGDAFHVGLACEGGTLVVTVDELANRSSMGSVTDEQLMREELAVVQQDKIFERTL